MTPPTRNVLGTTWTPPLTLSLALIASICLAPAATAAAPVFHNAADGGFTFDTGFLRGRLRAGGKSIGLQEVIHVPTGRRLDRDHGLLSHYRVFANGQRFGAGAWDWESAGTLREDGSVEVTWADAAERPFQLAATYRWIDSATLDVETRVQAKGTLRGFEVFLASYSDKAFTNAAVCIASEATKDQPLFLDTTRDAGEWQMFPRDEAVIPLIQDGRWTLEPHPVSWTIRPNFALPLARRRAPLSGVSSVLMAPSGECIAIATPHETEGHYSTYLSLFGTDVPAGEGRRARARWTVVVAKSDAAVVSLYKESAGTWEARNP